MFPVLFSIGPLTFYSYGFFAALSIYIGYQWMLHFTVREGFNKKAAQNYLHPLLIYIVIGGLLGGRLFYVLIYWRSFVGDFLGVFKIWEGGLVSYGAFLGAFAGFLLWYKKNRTVPWKKVADWLAPSLVLAHGVARLGCFFAGCCYGYQTEMPWAVIFRDPESLAPRWVPLHPTQLYEFVFLMCIGAFLVWQLKKKREGKIKDGSVFSHYLILYPAGRFFIEFLRDDDPKILSLTTGQWMSIFVFVIAVAFKNYLTRENDSANLK